MLTTNFFRRQVSCITEWFHLSATCCWGKSAQSISAKKKSTVARGFRKEFLACGNDRVSLNDKGTVVLFFAADHVIFSLGIFFPVWICVPCVTRVPFNVYCSWHVTLVQEIDFKSPKHWNLTLCLENFVQSTNPRLQQMKHTHLSDGIRCRGCCVFLPDNRVGGWYCLSTTRVLALHVWGLHVLPVFLLYFLQVL